MLVLKPVQWRLLQAILTSGELVGRPLPFADEAIYQIGNRRWSVTVFRSHVVVVALFCDRLDRRQG